MYSLICVEDEATLSDRYSSVNFPSEALLLNSVKPFFAPNHLSTLAVFHHRELKRFLRAPSIKIFNQSVIISLCFMIINRATLTTFRNLICASLVKLS